MAQVHDELITVETVLEEIGQTSLKFSRRVLSKEDGCELLGGYTVHALDEDKFDG